MLPLKICHYISHLSPFFTICLLYLTDHEQRQHNVSPGFYGSGGTPDSLASLASFSQYDYPAVSTVAEPSHTRGKWL